MRILVRKIAVLLIYRQLLTIMGLSNAPKVFLKIRSNKFFEPTASAVATGPLAQTLTTNFKYNNSDADILVRVYRDLPYLDLDIRVRWQEKRSLLKLCFPLGAIIFNL